MLDESEYSEIERKKEAKKREQLKENGKVSVKELNQLVLDEYNRITGFEETNRVAIHHHRISLYGSPCHKCGKPLRTDKASFCAACGHKVKNDE